MKGLRLRSLQLRLVMPLVALFVAGTAAMVGFIAWRAYDTANSLGDRELSLREAASLVGRSSEWLRQRVVSGTVDAQGNPTVTCNALPGTIGYCPPLAFAPHLRHPLAEDIATHAPGVNKSPTVALPRVPVASSRGIRGQQIASS